MLRDKERIANLKTYQKFIFHFPGYELLKISEIRLCTTTETLFTGSHSRAISTTFNNFLIPMK